MDEHIEREAALNFRLTVKLRPNELTAAQAVADAIMAYIKAIPSADVVPVVRCKDCKYRRDDGFCGGRGWPAQLVLEDGYCDKAAKMELITDCNQVKDGDGE